MPSQARFSDASMGAVAVATTERDHEEIATRGKHPLFDKPISMMVTTFALMASSLALFVWVTARLTLWLPGYNGFDRATSLLLLLSEIYVLVQSLGYYVQTVQALRTTNVSRETRLALLHQPAVAIYLATYNEPETVIEETVTAITLLDYPNKQIYINCDHPSSDQAAIVERIARRHGVHFIHRVPNTGYKAGGINAFIDRLGRDLPAADLLCIFDADSCPIPTFLREFVLHFVEDPRLAYVQAPQHYGNTDVSPVADAAAIQQATFAHYISEGKQESGAMFYCGTNVVFRVEALRDIGGLIVDSVTEDFATSMKLHARGWRSQYCNTAYVTGMGPTTLHAYWTQQGRWALGNIESFFMALPAILFKRGFTLLQRWEYFQTGTYYFVGCNAVIAMICPALFLLGNAHPLIISPYIYLLAFVPHVLIANWFFFLMMGRRSYSPRALFLSQCLTFVSFPVLVSAALAAVLRRRRPFAVTPKGAGTILSWWQLRWQFGMFGVLAFATLGGIIRLVLSGDLSVGINVVWCLYHMAMLGSIVFFNQPEHDIAAPALRE
jgi:cellulose synthase (UDP-forming)